MTCIPIVVPWSLLLFITHRDLLPIHDDQGIVGSGMFVLTTMSSSETATDATISDRLMSGFARSTDLRQMWPLVMAGADCGSSGLIR